MRISAKAAFRNPSRWCSPMKEQASGAKMIFFMSLGCYLSSWVLFSFIVRSTKESLSAKKDFVMGVQHYICIVWWTTSCFLLDNCHALDSRICPRPWIVKASKWYPQVHNTNDILVAPLRCEYLLHPTPTPWYLDSVADYAYSTSDRHIGSSFGRLLSLFYSNGEP